MTATPARYQPPYVSQKRRDPDGIYTDCAAESGIMLGACWTLGEWTRRPDGSMRSLHELSQVLRARIGDTAGGLTLHDVNDLLHELDPDLPDLPRYPGQTAKPGQSTAGATLRLTFAQLKDRLQTGSAAIVLGYLPNGRIGHAILAYRGNPEGATVLDPLTWNGLDWEGERWTWDRLRDFTERKVDGDRFGSPTAVAVAVVTIGAETEAARVERAAERQARRVAAAHAEQLTTARTALTRATTDLQAANARIAELEAATPPDCSAVIAERDAAVAALNEESDRAVRAEAVIEAVRRAVTP